MAIEDIVNQVCDVYQDLFKHQFPQSSRVSCLDDAKRMMKNDNVNVLVQKYYQQVNDRYSWS